jgi:L-threonylcarbamoyladenylate synthase
LPENVSFNKQQMISADLYTAKQVLENDGIISIPTETVYGLAGNAYKEDVVKKIFALKKRPLYNPLIVHIKSASFLLEVACDIPAAALQLAQHFWPGPLTLVLKKQPHIPELITAGKGTVAVRVPAHPLTLQLLQLLDFPLAAPSANPFGSISPTSAAHVAQYFDHEPNFFILDGGDCEKGIESTIIGFEGELPVLYRHGSIAAEAIEAITGKLKLITSNDTAPDAPGMLSRHYAPRTTTFLTDNVQQLMDDFAGKKIALLLFSNALENTHAIYQEVLSHIGNMEEAAKNLYAALHRLDACGADIIIAEKLPESGLGISINDRLQRATKR